MKRLTLILALLFPLSGQAAPTQILTLQIPSGGGSNPHGTLEVMSTATLTIDSGATIINNGTATGFSGSPSGAAGGDLGGTYPNPSVLTLQGGSLIPDPLKGADNIGFGFYETGETDVPSGLYLSYGTPGPSDLITPQAGICLNAEGTASNVLYTTFNYGSTWTPIIFGTVTSVTPGTGLSGGTITSTGTISLTAPVTVALGGTGTTTLPSGDIIIGNGTSAVTVIAPGTGVAGGLATAVNTGTGFETAAGAASTYLPLTGGTLSGGLNVANFSVVSESDLLGMQGATSNTNLAASYGAVNFNISQTNATAGNFGAVTFRDAPGNVAAQVVTIFTSHTSNAPVGSMAFQVTNGSTTLIPALTIDYQGAHSAYGFTDTTTGKTLGLAIEYEGTGTLSSGTATFTVPSGAHPIVMDTNTTSLTNVGSLGVSVSGTTATVKSTNVLDTSTFNYFY